MNGAGQEDLRKLCATGHLYAIVDSCDEPAAAKRFESMDSDRAVSLYRGGAEEQYAHVAPYLVRVDDSCFEWIAGSVWSSPWGIFSYANAPMQTLRTHFRRFLKVKGTDQKEYLLRFYDPRILPAFLGSCNDPELAQFFGPVQAYAANKDAGVSVFQLAAPARI